MFAVFDPARKVLIRVLALFALLTVAACQPVSLGGSGPSINTDKPVPVALLVPAGSGQAGDEALAKSLENAARLAIADLQGVKIDLRVYATAGSAATAATVAGEAIKDGAKVILGPVFAESANAAGQVAAGRGINVLAFSNNTTIAGGNVFVLGSTFQNTANRLVGYAASQGRTNMLVLHATNLSGQVGKQAIDAAIARRGISNAGSVPYEFSQNGVVQAVSTVRDNVRSSGANAIFMDADTSGALPLFQQLLPEAGIDKEEVRFIGLTRWDIPPQTLSLPGVQEGWFALPDPNMTAAYQARYQSAYGDTPHPISGLAYDGIAAIGALVKAGHSDALTVGALTQGAGFQGVNGIFRLRPDGTNERGLAVATVREKQVVVIDPAPRSFGGPEF
jgi:hypothetical protein